ncbi:MAG TPA: hypothetical protein VGO62_00205 [Myxococcota bacterium]
MNRAPPAPPPVSTTSPEAPSAQKDPLKDILTAQRNTDQMEGVRAKVKRQPPPAAQPPQSLSDQVLSMVSDFTSRVKASLPGSKVASQPNDQAKPVVG